MVQGLSSGLFIHMEPLIRCRHPGVGPRRFQAPSWRMSWLSSGTHSGDRHPRSLWSVCVFHARPDHRFDGTCDAIDDFTLGVATTQYDGGGIEPDFAPCLALLLQACSPFF